MSDDRPPFIPMPPASYERSKQFEFDIVHWEDGEEHSWTIKGTLELKDHYSGTFPEAGSTFTQAAWAFVHRIQEDYPECRGRGVDTHRTDAVHPAHW